MTALTQLFKLNEYVRKHNDSGSDNEEKPVLVWMDMDLYKRVRKLPFLDPYFDRKVIVSPGPFHTVLCALRCLGATIENSGLDSALVEADIYSSITVVQIINGKHHNRAIEAHQIILQVLFDLWIDAFLKANPSIANELTIGLQKIEEACHMGTDVRELHYEMLTLMKRIKVKEKLEEFDHENKKYPMYQWICM